MQTITIAGYKFIALDELVSLRDQLLMCCQQLELKGTILLSSEGININVSGTLQNIELFKSELKTDLRFADISFRESYAKSQPFKRLKIKIKREIITLRQAEANPIATKAKRVAPETLKQWLDENRDITLLDVRNEYEIRFGTFVNAISLQLKHFTDFPKASEQIDRNKPIVMFCTGGIRCEKAALYLMKQGISDVYQLEGGILNYFAKTNGEHYQGECFVFDERVSVRVDLKDSETNQ